ncbi:unnamed protein product, partial [Amoebophrya sp. A25]
GDRAVSHDTGSERNQKRRGYTHSVREEAIPVESQSHLLQNTSPTRTRPMQESRDGPDQCQRVMGDDDTDCCRLLQTLLKDYRDNPCANVFVGQTLGQPASFAKLFTEDLGFSLTESLASADGPKNSGCARDHRQKRETLDWYASDIDERIALRELAAHACSRMSGPPPPVEEQESEPLPKRGKKTGAARGAPFMKSLGRLEGIPSQEWRRALDCLNVDARTLHPCLTFADLPPLMFTSHAAT